ncbi:MAG: hypothetical protein NZL95_02055 [Chitinophagales bacterium]|nr:hypothetical protein [Chitinophagales bacterium]MDW8427317.1 hypothetical protein [Chitinophagales bacterium]
MRGIFLLLGVILLLAGLIPLARHGLNYGQLTDYGKGYVWGKVILALIGLTLMAVSRNLKKSN